MKMLLLQTLLNHLVTKHMVFSVWNGDTFLISRHATNEIDTTRVLNLLSGCGYLHFRIYPTATAIMPIAWVMIDFERSAQTGRYDFYDYIGGDFAKSWNHDFVEVYARSKSEEINHANY